MKKWIFLLSLLLGLTARAEPIGEKKKTTSYIPTGHCTAVGIIPHKGIIAARRADLYKTAAVYRRGDNDELLEFMGYYECLDTGKGANGSIKKGRVIDIFCEREEDIQPNCKVWVFWYEAEG